MGKSRKYLWIFIIVVCGVVGLHQTSAMAYIADADFTDWTGSGSINDVQEGFPVYDLAFLKWGTNSGEDNVYFDLQRNVSSRDAKSSMFALVSIDTDNNGVFTDSVDRKIQTEYIPNSQTVNVYVMDPSGTSINAYSGKWGEKFKPVGQQFEFYVSFADLGIIPGQVMQMYVQSSNDSSFVNTDRLPDQGVIQIAPFDTGPWLFRLGPIIIILLIIGYRWVRYHSHFPRLTQRRGQL